MEIRYEWYSCGKKLFRNQSTLTFTSVGRHNWANYTKYASLFCNPERLGTVSGTISGLKPDHSFSINVYNVFRAFLDSLQLLRHCFILLHCTFHQAYFVKDYAKASSAISAE